MLNPKRLIVSASLLFLMCAATLAHAAYVDPPGRVARLSDSRGDVSFSPAGEADWYQAIRNRPLVRGDRLWTERGARAELQMGSAAVRLGPNTSFEILELNDNIAQLQLTQGTLNLRVRRLYRGQVIEVATPTLAFTVERAGRYRIDVDPEYNETTIVVWEGAGEAYGEYENFPLAAGDAVRFYDADLSDYEIYGLPAPDGFDRYCQSRDQRLDRSVSLRYVNDDVVGYYDLDEYGSWSSVRSYGNVWFPTRVDSDWAPYRDGNWVWQEPWGWTWVDNAPWGFAPSHYGRWAYISNRWGWIPGPRNVRPIYAPALVAFVGGRDWSLSVALGGRSRDRGPIGWFPLGPSEVYVPSYRASRDYFSRVNINNTVVNNTTVINVYNNYASGRGDAIQNNYVHRSVPGAMTAVPMDVFANSRSVRQAALTMDRNAYATGEVSRMAPVAPNRRSVIGPGSEATARPDARAFDRSVIARNAPPPEPVPFATREQQLQRNPGQVPEQRQSGPAPTRGGTTREHIRVLSGGREDVNARDSASSRDDAAPGRGNQPGKLVPLDRSAAPASDRGRRQNEGADRSAADQRRDAQLPRDRSGGDMNRQTRDQQQMQEQQRRVDQQRAQDQQRAVDQRNAQDQQRALEQQRNDEAAQQRRQRQNAADEQAQRQQAELARQQREADAQQQVERDRAMRDQRNREVEVQRQQAEERQNQTRRQAEQERLATLQREADAKQAERAQAQQAQAQQQAEAQQRATAQQQAEQQAREQAEQQAQKRRADREAEAARIRAEREAAKAKAESDEDEEDKPDNRARGRGRDSEPEDRS